MQGRENSKFSEIGSEISKEINNSEISGSRFLMSLGVTKNPGSSMIGGSGDGKEAFGSINGALKALEGSTGSEFSKGSICIGIKRILKGSTDSGSTGIKKSTGSGSMEILEGLTDSEIL